MQNGTLRLENLVKVFGDTPVVNNISLDIADGEFLALLGPSGCGKTTLLRMIGGFEYPTRGRLFIGGEDITLLPPNKRPVNMLFQSYAVFPHMTVAENVAYGLRMEKRPAAEIGERVTEALQLVQMHEFAARRPDTLSGGQRQRVALARALIKKPRVLLLDEPLSALDAKLREAMQTELVRLQKTVGITFVVVTHDQNEALSMANRIAVMEKGVFRQVDTPRVLYDNPDNQFVADFIGRMNMHPCVLKQSADTVQHIQTGYAGDIAVPLAPLAAAAAGTRMLCGVRPERVTFTIEKPAAEICCPATLESYSYHGDETVLYCRCQDGSLWLSARPNTRAQTDDTGLTAGQLGFLSWSPASIILLAG